MKADAKTKFIERYVVSTASLHDSKTVEKLLGNEDEYQPLYADSAYSGKPVEEILDARNVIGMIHEKGARNNPLTDEQKTLNKIKICSQSKS